MALLIKTATPNPVAGVSPTIRIVALLAICLAIWGALDFPYAGVPLVSLLLLCVIALFINPRSWLIFLPALLPIIYLVPWSGRILWTSFDLILLASLAAIIWQGGYRFKGIATQNRRIVASLLIFSVAWLLSMVIGLLPLDRFDTNALNNYHSNYNAIQIGKSLVWALLFLPAINHYWDADNIGCRQHLLTGTSLGLLSVGLIVLWERGAIEGILEAQSIYALVGPLLDFSTPYRVTGFFADMHTGGAAIDGYLLLATPLALHGTLVQKHYGLKALSICAFLLGLYSLLVTFTRSTYAAFAISALLFSAGILYKVGLNRVKRPLLTFTLLPICLTLIFLLLFRKGGSIALAAGLLLASAALIAPAVARKFGQPFTWFYAGCALLFCFVSMTYGLHTSKWVDNSIAETLSYGFLSSSLILATTYQVGAKFSDIINWRQTVSFAFLASLMLILVIPSTFGTRMEQRFDNLDRDVTTRASHWTTTLKLMGTKLSNHLFGLGLGTFPNHYIKLSDRHAGSLAYLTEENSTFLRIGGDDDFKVGQRFNNHDKLQLKLTFSARSQQSKGLIYAALARKPINNQKGSNPHSKTERVIVQQGTNEWQHFELLFDISKFGSLKWYQGFPLSLLFVNPRSGTTVDIDNIRLTDIDGNGLIANGNFESGGDRWFYYNDIKHLPWHIKNVWLNVYFEMGALGLIAFILFIGLLLNRALQHIGSSIGLVVPLTAAVIGYLALGMSDSLLDSSRCALLFFFLVFVLIKELQTESRTTSVG